MIVGSVLTPTLLANAGLASEEAPERFRRWLTRLLVAHLDRHP